jgi:hypothetical protein
MAGTPLPKNIDLDKGLLKSFTDIMRLKPDSAPKKGTKDSKEPEF